MRLVARLAMGLCPLILVCQRSAVGEESNAAAAMRAAWNARAVRLSDACVEWTIERWHAPETLIVSAAGQQVASAAKRGNANAAPITTRARLELLLVGSSWLERRQGSEWFPDLADLRERESLVLLDRRTRSRFDGGVAEVAEPAAEIELLHDQVLFSLQDMPVFLALRPADSIVGPFRDRENWKLLDEPVSVEGRECLVLEHRREWFAASLSAAEYVERVYVDPERGHAVVRWTEWGGGNLIVQMDIDYLEHDGLWLPSAWHAQIFRAREPHDLIEEQTVEQVAWQVGDVAELPDFAALLPPRTLLRDHRSQRAWLVRDDGAHRPVTADELARNVSRMELLALPPGWTGRPIAYRAYSSLAWVVPLALTLAVVGLFYLRMRAARRA